MENDPTAVVLVTGPNFGYGPLHEQAVKALLAQGFRAVISTQFASSFERSAYENGLLAVIVSERAANICLRTNLLEVHLPDHTIRFANGSRLDFHMDPVGDMVLSAGGYLRFMFEMQPRVRKWLAQRR